MAHTINKKIYSEQQKRYLDCEVLILDEEENLPQTDRREIVLFCNAEILYNDSDDNIPVEGYPETELIEQYEENYEDFDIDKYKD